MMLKERLRDHMGKMIVVTAIREKTPFEVKGVVEERDDDIVLTMVRRLDKGPPIGHDPRTGELIHQETITPQSTIYLTDIDMTNVILLRVIEETLQEAKAILSGEKPKILQPVPVIPNGVFKP